MVLGDSEILRLINEGHVKNVLLDKVNPASLNVRIGTSFLVPKRVLLGVMLGEEVRYERFDIKPDEYFCLKPGQFALATTMEELDVPRTLAAFVQGRSSIGRAGLTVQNAGFIDPGFHGHITLELKNETRNCLYIRPGYPVAQIVFMEAVNVAKPYSGKYNGQKAATGSRMHLDKEAILK